MNIAIPIENGNIAPCFGTVEGQTVGYELAIYDIDNNTIKDITHHICFSNSNDAIVYGLEENLVYVVICDDINPDTLQAIRDDFPTVYTGVKGSPEKAIQDFLSGKLASKN